MGQMNPFDFMGPRGPYPPQFRMGIPPQGPPGPPGQVRKDKKLFVSIVVSTLPTKNSTPRLTLSLPKSPRCAIEISAVPTQTLLLQGDILLNFNQILYWD